MARSTVFGKAHKCPNCHAYIAAEADRVRCEYCGVMVTVREAPPPGPPPPVAPPPPLVVVRPASPQTSSSHHGPRFWPAFLVAPVMVGGILFYSYWMQKQAMDRAQAASQQAAEASNRASTPKPAVTPTATPPVRPPRPAAAPAGVKQKVDSICHLSANDISGVLDAKKNEVLACFHEEKPPKGATRIDADVDVVVDAQGGVDDVDIRYVVMDASKKWKPDSSARKCAEKRMRAWKFPQPSGDMATKCNFRMTVIQTGELE